MNGDAKGNGMKMGGWSHLHGGMGSKLGGWGAKLGGGGGY